MRRQEAYVLDGCAKKHYADVQLQVFGREWLLEVNWSQKDVEQTRKMRGFTGCGLILI
jgi:hypothetical protein